MSGSSPDKQRAHTERMLARAQKRLAQANKLVEKWKARLTELDRAGVAARQATLWAEEQQETKPIGEDYAPASDSSGSVSGFFLLGLSKDNSAAE